MGVDARDPLGDALDVLDRNEARRRALDAEMLEALGELQERWEREPWMPELYTELASRQRISQTTALERLRMARALCDLPALRATHAEARLSWDQLRWVTRFAVPETDAVWARIAPEKTPYQLKLESDRQARLRREEADSDRRGRYLWMGWDEDKKNLSVEGRLPAEQGAAFLDAVARAAEQLQVEEDVEDRRGARQADALVALVTSSGDRAQRPTLVVHADAEVLAGVRDGTRHLAETASGVQLRPEAVRRLACDAKVRVALEREGTPVGVVTSGRHVSDQQMELLRFRDRCCTFPGCERTWFLHAHHVRHWADGGRTTLDNLTLLCGTHHRMLHEGGWTIRGRPPDGMEFVDTWGNVRSDRTSALAMAG